METLPAARPLDGIRVLELGQILAGPFAGSLLGYFGAEVIKVEPPGGDPIRTWREMDGDTSLWWRSLGRNKKCVTIDLRTEKGRELVRRLALQSDVMIENFRPGTLERWGLDPEVLRQENPKLICARISGFGQTGPRSGQRGYASVCEAYGGLRYVTGEPGQRPVRSNLSLGDSLAGLQATMGVLLALFERQKSERGQDIDLGLFEAVFNMLEASIPEFDRNGVVREASGSTVTGIVPTNTYACRDGQYLIIGGSGDSIFKRLMNAAGRADMAEDPRFATNDGRVAHEPEIDAALTAWCRTLSLEEALEVLEEAEVPAGPIYSVRDMFEDPHYEARDLFETHDVGGQPLRLAAIQPKLSRTPGRTDWPGPDVGAHNEAVLGSLLELDDEEIAGLRRDGVV